MSDTSKNTTPLLKNTDTQKINNFPENYRKFSNKKMKNNNYFHHAEAATKLLNKVENEEFDKEMKLAIKENPAVRKFVNDYNNMKAEFESFQEDHFILSEEKEKLELKYARVIEQQDKLKRELEAERESVVVAKLSEELKGTTELAHIYKSERDSERENNLKLSNELSEAQAEYERLRIYASKNKTIMKNWKKDAYIQQLEAKLESFHHPGAPCISDKKIEQICELYQNKTTIPEICREVEVSNPTVKKYLKLRGLMR